MAAYCIDNPMMAAVILLCVLPLATSLPSTVICSGTFYQPDPCLYRMYPKVYYNSYKGSCNFFNYMECIYELPRHGYGNPHNKFDSIRDCEDTCFSVRNILSTSSSITSSITSSLTATVTGTQSTADESVPLSTSSPLMTSPSPVMIISSSNMSGMSSGIGFMPTSTLMLNPTRSLTVSVGRASTADGVLSFLGTSTYTGPPLSISPSLSTSLSSSIPFLSSLFSSSISSNFSISSPSLSTSLSFPHTSPSSYSLHSSQPYLISSTSSTISASHELFNLFLFISGAILFVIVIFIISQLLYFIVLCYLAARRKRCSKTSLRIVMSLTSAVAVETGEQPLDI